MWYPAKITEAASSDAISIEEVKAQAIVEQSDDDTLLQRLIKVGQDHVERYCGLRFAKQTIEAKCDSFANLCRLPEAPTVSITSIGYVDRDGNGQTVASSVYEERLEGLEPSIVLKYGQAWPAIQIGSRITLTAVVGYETAPAAVKHAMLMLIATWYARRENVITGSSTVENLPMPAGVDALLCNFRRGI